MKSAKEWAEAGVTATFPAVRHHIETAIKAVQDDAVASERARANAWRCKVGFCFGAVAILGFGSWLASVGYNWEESRSWSFLCAGAFGYGGCWALSFSAAESEVSK